MDGGVPVSVEQVRLCAPLHQQPHKLRLVPKTRLVQRRPHHACGRQVDVDSELEESLGGGVVVLSDCKVEEGPAVHVAERGEFDGVFGEHVFELLVAAVDDQLQQLVLHLLDGAEVVLPDPPLALPAQNQRLLVLDELLAVLGLACFYILDQYFLLLVGRPMSLPSGSTV